MTLTATTRMSIAATPAEEYRMVSIDFLCIRPPNQVVRCVRKITLVANSENPITDRKKITSRESSTPFSKPLKCVTTLNDVMTSTSHCQPCVRFWSRLITGGKPASTRNRHTITEMMKLTTWLRVMADVMQLTARYAPAINQLPM